MMKKALLIILFISFVCTAASFAESPNEIYRKANLSYENEDYEKAVSLYEMLLKMDKVSSEVFYNLGNSYFKLKNIGKAILNYERSLRLDPRDRDAMLNLKLARSMTMDKIELPPKGFILTVILFLYDRMNLNELVLLTSAIYLLIILLLIFSIFFIAKRRIIFYNVGVLLIVLTSSMTFLISKISSENIVKRGVILAEKVGVRSGPKEDYLLQFSLHEGTVVRVVEEREFWYEIDLSKDLRGWLPKDSVEVI